MLELTFFVLLFGLIFIGYRLNTSLKIQRELLNDVKQMLARLTESEGHLRTMRKAYEAQTK